MPVSAGPDPNVDVNQIEQARRQINRLAEEIAHLSEMELAPAEYYGEFLQRLLNAIAAPAGAVWLRTQQGNLQLQYQQNMRQVGLDSTENSRQMHDELLRNAVMKGQPISFPPHSGMGTPDGGGVAAANPTPYVILMAPILYDKQVVGLVEVWQEPSRGPDAQRGFLQFMVRMAQLASGYTRNYQLRQMVGKEQVWTQLEDFTRRIHATLNPTEVSYLIANEGRRLAECDRVSVAMRLGSRPQVTAISGADVVEKRSNLVQLMRKLFEEVMKWGEKLVYSGAKDDTLPPGVLKALDAYLAESNSKLLVVLPLRDDRETNTKRPPRSGLMMEAFEPPTAAEQMVQRLEVIGRHSGSALFNASEYRRIPMRFLWMPLAKLQDGLGGKAKAIWTLVLLGLMVLTVAMIFVPYPLKMEAGGQTLPIKRQYAYALSDAQVKGFREGLRPGDMVFKDSEIIQMFDQKLADELNKLKVEIDSEEATIKAGRGAPSSDGDAALKSRVAEIRKQAKEKQRDDLIRHYNARPLNPGEYWVRAPQTGIILTSDFQDLKNRVVKASDPLMRIGYVEDAKRPDRKDWEIELKIPQKHIGQVLAAYQNLNTEKLDVDLLVTSAPTQTFRGKLLRTNISPEANPNRDANNESEPVVIAKVTIADDDIPEEMRLDPNLLRIAGVEVRSRIRCGNHAMGYSLFYGVWEFIYEKIVFFF